MTFFKKHINQQETKYKEIFDTYYYRVFMYVARKIKNREDVLDTTQNVFKHLWNYRQNLLISDTDAIIFNTCNQEIAGFYKRNKIQLSLLESSIESYMDDSNESIDSKVAQDQLLEFVFANIDQLPPLRKKIFTMNKLNGITQQQIANELQLPQHTVKYHISEAMNFLKRIRLNP